MSYISQLAENYMKFVPEASREEIQRLIAAANDIKDFSEQYHGSKEYECDVRIIAAIQTVIDGLNDDDPNKEKLLQFNIKAKKVQGNSYFNELPAEILLQIEGHLTVSAKSQLAQTSRRLFGLADNAEVLFSRPPKMRIRLAKKQVHELLMYSTPKDIDKVKAMLDKDPGLLLESVMLDRKGRKYMRTVFQNALIRIFIDIDRNIELYKLIESYFDKLPNGLEKKVEQSIKLAADQFDNWMHDSEESCRRLGYYDNNNKALVSFLNDVSGFGYIKTYDELCKLAEQLQAKGYKTTNPPCTPIDFAKAIVKAESAAFVGVAPTIPEAAKLELVAVNLEVAADRFDEWMHAFEKSHRELGNYDDNNKALVSFLNQGEGFRNIKTYDELCKLAEQLQAKGYKTTNPPCTPTDFAKAINEANPARFGGVAPTIPVEVVANLRSRR